MMLYETTQLLQLLVTAYPKSNIPATEKAVKLWQEMLADIPVELVLTATKRLIATNVYPPTIADVRRNVVEALDSTNKRPDGNEAWGEVRRAISRHGYYGTEEAKKMLMPDIWPIVARIGWRDICMCEEDNIGYVRNQFVKSWEAEEHRRKMGMLVPQAIQERFAALWNDVSFATFSAGAPLTDNEKIPLYLLPNDE